MKNTKLFSAAFDLAQVNGITLSEKKFNKELTKMTNKTKRK